MFYSLEERSRVRLRASAARAEGSTFRPCCSNSTSSSLTQLYTHSPRPFQASSRAQDIITAQLYSSQTRH